MSRAPQDQRENHEAADDGQAHGEVGVARAEDDACGGEQQVPCLEQIADAAQQEERAEQGRELGHCLGLDLDAAQASDRARVSRLRSGRCGTQLYAAQDEVDKRGAYQGDNQ